ncbi:hypothetical protein EHM76_05115, partial [bacterium]
MSDWRFGETAALDNYEELPPAPTRITVRPLRFDLPLAEASSEEDRRLAEYAASLVREPRKEPPPPITPSVYDTKSYVIQPEQREVRAGNLAAAERLARPYARANRESQTNLLPVVDFLKPETPLDYALMVGTGGTGLIGKAAMSLPRAFRIGAVAAGAAATADPAQAGVSKAATKALRGLDAWADTPSREQVAQNFILPGDTRVSTRFPKAVESTEDPLRQHLSVGMSDMFKQSTPEQLWHNIALISQYPGFKRLQGMSPEDAARAYVDQ